MLVRIAFLLLCALILPVYGNFTYSYNLSSKEGTVTGYDGTDENVVIPSTFRVSEKYTDEDDGETHTRYHTIKVVSIGARAFSGKTNIKSIAFPSGLRIIGNSAFYGCTGIVSIKTPSALNALGGNAFYGCTALETVEINGTNLNLGKSQDVFCGCSSLRKIKFGDGVVSLPIGNSSSNYNGPFVGCTALEEVIVGSGVTEIPKAFLNANYSNQAPKPTKVSFAGKIKRVGSCSMGVSSLQDLTIELADGCVVEAYAFEGCSGVTCESVDFSKIASIGARAFSWCSGIAGEIDISKSAYVEDRAFKGCANLTDVKFAVNLKSIGVRAFYMCSSLKSIDLPEALTSIGTMAFCDCTALERVEINGTNLNLGKSQDVFCGCSSLRKIKFGDGVVSLPIGNSSSNYNGPFVGCTALEEVIVGSGVTEIPKAFLNANYSNQAPKPTKVSFAGKIKRVGSCSMGVSSLQDLTIELAEGCVIDGYAFSGCPIVSQANIDFSKISSIGGYAFEWCGGLKGEIDLSTVESIGDGAFYYCNNITSVILSDQLKSIPWKTFNGCTSLKSVKMPKSLISLGTNAFYDCSELKSIILSESFDSIGQWVFTYCVNLDYIYFEGPPPSSVGGGAFSSVKSGCYGYYTAEHAAAWEAVIGSNGKWNGLIMKEAQMCTVTYDVNGGSVKDSLFDDVIIQQEFIGGVEGKLDPCPFVKEGYDFKGWAETEDGEVVYADEAVVAFNGDKILYAVWEKYHDYRLRFDSGGGIGEMKDIPLEYGERTVLPVCDFEKEGYTFVGWGIQPGLTIKDNKDAILPAGHEWWIDDESLVGYSAVVDGVCTLHAVWVRNFKVRLVATEGVLVDEDGNPVKDENGKFITEITQEFPRDKSVSLMKNPFKRGNNIFLGWSRYPDVDLRKEVYENRKSLDQVLYQDEASLYFDAENPEEEVTLYAIWTMSLRCSFNNLEPEDLKNHLYWRCLGQVVDGKLEEYWSDCRDGDCVELLPGSHDIYFGIKEGYSWIIDNQELLRMKESIHLPSASSGLLPPMLGSNHGWGRSIDVDVPYVKSAQTGSVKFYCIPETSQTLGYYASLYPFDLSKVTIEILSLYSNGLITKPIVIKNGKYVTFPAGKYQALISYDNSASSGEGFSWYATEGWSSYYRGFEVEPANYQKVIPVNFALDIVGQPVYREECTVRFDPQDGKVDVSELTFMRMIREDLNQPKKNAVITYLPEATHRGKRFIGWWTEPMPTWKKVADGLKASDWLLFEIFKDTGRLVQVGDEITGDCTLYARWVGYDSSMTVDGDKLTGVSTEIRTITVPYTIHFVSASAFELVEEPMSIVFAGDAPEVEEGAFEKLPADSVVYVKRSSSGWNTDIPGIWKGVKIEYVDDVIPAIANDSEIRNVFSGMADGERLSSHIKDEDGYNYFRIWSMYSDNINPLEVKSSPNAWLSYALDADGLIADAPKDGDVVITNFEKTETDGAFEFTVKIDGVEVGDSALEANLKKVFDIEGAETLASGGAGFSSDNIEVNIVTPVNGNVKFIVTPKMGNGELGTGNGEKPDSFFFRVKMK